MQLGTQEGSGSVGQKNEACKAKAVSTTCKAKAVHVWPGAQNV